MYNLHSDAVGNYEVHELIMTKSIALPAMLIHSYTLREKRKVHSHILQSKDAGSCVKL